MTDRIKNLAKGGWNPEKDAGSGAGGVHDSKMNQVKGWVGKAQGRDTHSAAALQHQSAPLSTLKDPSSFAPPPRRGEYNGGSAASTSTAPAPKPTAFQPSTASSAARPGARPAPSLPPRLPARQNSHPDAYAPAPPPTYTEAAGQEAATQGVMNQGALNRLGQAGVSVPGLGIGKTPPPVPPRQNSASSSNAPVSPAAPAGQNPHLGELQSRFSNMSTSSSRAPAPATGTTWADKQAAIQTANSLRDDPSKVSASDLRGAARTASNFQQRHGDQVASGFRAASGLNQKYGIAARANQLASSSAAPTSPSESTPGVGKKPAPPPPPRRREFGGSSDEPPPIPLSSKPKF